MNTPAPAKTPERMEEDLCRLLLGEAKRSGYRVSNGEILVAAGQKIGKRMIRKIIKHRADVELDRLSLRSRLRILLQLEGPENEKACLV